MRTLTPNQKIEAYGYAILSVYAGEEYNEAESPYVCDILREWVINKFGEYRSPSEMPCQFPEFGEQRPNTSSFFWWDEEDKTSRIKALERAINLVK